MLQAPPTKKSVAVLYFENQSGGKEDEYFRDGMTEDIITELSKITQLQIFPRSEMLAFRDKQTAAPQVGQQLGATFVLEGTIRRSGNRLRITAQLVEISTRHSVWAERYDRQLEDVFAIQDEIARSIAQALRITLTPQEEKTIGQKPTENTQAYDFYLRGRSYTRRENMDYALQMFDQAIQLDGNFALAHAGIANLCGLIYELREQSQKWIEKGLAACDRAMAMAPTSPRSWLPAPDCFTLRRNMRNQNRWRAGPSNESTTATVPGIFWAVHCCRSEIMKRQPDSRSRLSKPTGTITTRISRMAFAWNDWGERKKRKIYASE